MKKISDPSQLFNEDFFEEMMRLEMKRVITMERKAPTFGISRDKKLIKAAKRIYNYYSPPSEHI